MLPQQTRILIVGAGPAGLCAAISLLHHGCKPEDLLIVDAMEERTGAASTSRAMAVHAATLEALESINCATNLISSGITTQKLTIWNRISPIFTLDLSVLSPHTHFPYVLVIPQNKTEEILEEHLMGVGVQVRRGCRVVGIREGREGRWGNGGNGEGGGEGKGGMEVMFENGEVVSAEYVIGADGAKSTIRTLSGIPFADPDGLAVDDSLAQIVLADVVFEGMNDILPGDKGGVMATMAGGSFFFVIPLQRGWSEGEGVGAGASGAGASASANTDTNADTNAETSADTGTHKETPTIYRIGFNIPASQGPPPSSPSIEYLQEHLNKHGPLGLSSVRVTDKGSNKDESQAVYIKEKIWSTRFRTHAAMAGKFVFRFRDQVQRPQPQQEQEQQQQQQEHTTEDDQNLGGYVFLIGDAAHIHSPAGGQGMNLGIRDAIGLGPALLSHIALKTPPSRMEDGPLYAYGETRRKSAMGVIRLTKRIMGVVSVVGGTGAGEGGGGGGGGGIMGWVPKVDVRYWVLRVLSVLPVVRGIIAWQVSGLGNR